MFLTRISVAQPVFATMIMVALMVIGIYSFQRLPIEQLPDVDFPVVAVVVSYPGASPEAVETNIIEPIEEAVNTISGIDSIQATARSGEAMIVLMFDLGIDSSIAAQDVRDRIATVEALLPDSANDPMLFPNPVTARPDRVDRRCDRTTPVDHSRRWSGHCRGRRAAPVERPDRPGPFDRLWCRRR
jgi:multidrug efflux pump subunit AcrB